MPSPSSRYRARLLQQPRSYQSASTRTRRWLIPAVFLCGVLCTSLVIYSTTVLVEITTSAEQQQQEHHQHQESTSTTTSTTTSSLADGCSCVFLDVGANRGIQTRKLFEPTLYSGSKWPRQFAESFGDLSFIRSNCCSFGFEPNPLHKDELQKLEAAYNRKGWRTIFFHAAAWTSETNLTFLHEYMGANQTDGKELSSRLTPGAKRGPLETVPTLDLAKFIREHILTRQWDDDSNNKKGTVIMKLDVEGAEYTILPKLVVTGALCELDQVALEWHPFRAGGKKPRGEEFQSLLQEGGCLVQLIQMDDESYYDSSFRLPK